MTPTWAWKPTPRSPAHTLSKSWVQVGQVNWVPLEQRPACGASAPRPTSPTSIIDWEEAGGIWCFPFPSHLQLFSSFSVLGRFSIIKHGGWPSKALVIQACLDPILSKINLLLCVSALSLHYLPHSTGCAKLKCTCLQFFPLLQTTISPPIHPFIF